MAERQVPQPSRGTDSPRADGACSALQYHIRGITLSPQAHFYNLLRSPGRDVQGLLSAPDSEPGPRSASNAGFKLSFILCAFLVLNMDSSLTLTIGVWPLFSWTIYFR